MSSRTIEHLVQATPVEFDPFSAGELMLTFPSTEAQREIWLATQMGDAANCAFNESLWMRLRGRLDVPACCVAFEQLVMRHEALHCVLSPDGEMLCIESEPSSSLSLTDITAEPSPRELFNTMLLEEVTMPFDLIEGPLFRGRLVRLDVEEYCIILTAHHIVCDGWSWGVLLDDFVALYADCQLRQPSTLPAAELFSDFASAQHKEAAGPDRIAARSYWQGALADKFPVFDLPTDRPRPLLKTYHAARLDYRLSGALTASLRQLGAQHGCTLFTTLLAGFALFLQRITQQQNVLLGVTAAGQLASGQLQLVGHCTNLLPLRTIIDTEKGFIEYLPELNTTLLDAYEHQQVTFGELLKSITPPRDPSRLPLLPVRFNLARETGANGIRARGIEFEMFTNARAYENFEIFLDCMETKGSLALECYYNTDLFQVSTMLRRLQEFETLLLSIVAAPRQPMATLPLLPKAEVQSLDADQIVSEAVTEKLHLALDTKVVVLDSHLQRLPIGIAGELCIATGACEQVRYGFQQLEEIAGHPPLPVALKYYKTGYLGCYEANGTLRMDGKVENRLIVKGFPCSLETIEAVLEEHPAVERAAVTYEGGAQLVAHLIAKEDSSEPLQAASLRRFLRQRLPHSMVPARFITLRELPWNTHGEVDRPALANRNGSPLPEPQPDALELELANLWKRILQVSSIATHDSFFDLGGTSFQVMILSRSVEKKYNRRLPLAAFFEADTVAELAQLLRTS